MTLDNVKPGDSLVWERNSTKRWELFQVKRVTATQVICEGPGVAEWRFRKDGREVGKSRGWEPVKVRPAKEPDLNRVRKQEERARHESLIRSTLSGYRLAQLSDEKLAAICAILEG